MNDDLAIARAVKMRPIVDVAEELGLVRDDVSLYGNYKAKVSYKALRKITSHDISKKGKIVLVTAITPTPAGEGKTTTTIGLAQALCRIGKKAIAAIREPSMGPVFGMKGGAAGGGRSQVLPMEDINLHFTGDMHAIGSAHNLLAAMLDNHLHHGNSLGIDARTIQFPRVMDMNDRSLRQTVIGLGGRTGGVPRESGFSITVASEVMAIFCLSNDLTELKERLSRIVVSHTYDRRPVTAADLKSHGAMAALLREALQPNLVQTLEGTPAFVHGGPFANIAHGCSSVIATRAARNLGEIVVTEGGFGSDLGFEKYCDIVAPSAGLPPDAAVLVVTIRALKMHGGVSKSRLYSENLEAVQRGLPNIDRHIANIGQMGIPFVVTLNKFNEDTDAEIDIVRKHIQNRGAEFAICDCWARGGEGGEELAYSVLKRLEHSSDFKPLYSQDMTIMEKLKAIVSKVYGADDLVLEPEAKAQLRWLEENGFKNLGVCIAKTQYSLSDDPKAGGNPEGFVITVRSLIPSAGAGFVVAITGDVMTMPGLPESPSAEQIDLDDAGNITGLF